MPARLSADDYVALAGVHALVAATDVRSIVFLRVSLSRRELCLWCAARWKLTRRL
jgi:hypothetical protein